MVGETREEGRVGLQLTDLLRICVKIRIINMLTNYPLVSTPLFQILKLLKKFIRTLI